MKFTISGMIHKKLDEKSDELLEQDPSFKNSLKEFGLGFIEGLLDAWTWFGCFLWFILVIARIQSKFQK